MQRTGLGARTWDHSANAVKSTVHRHSVMVQSPARSCREKWRESAWFKNLIWLYASSFNRTIDWLIDWLIHWLVDPLIDWSIDRSIEPSLYFKCNSQVFCGISILSCVTQFPGRHTIIRLTVRRRSMQCCSIASCWWLISSGFLSCSVCLLAANPLSWTASCTACLTRSMCAFRSGVDSAQPLMVYWKRDLKINEK